MYTLKNAKKKFLSTKIWENDLISLKRIQNRWDYPYESLHVSHDQRCSIDVTDLADIFTVGRPNQVRKKPKISAQKCEPFSRYKCHKYEGVDYIWSTF
jgi:hypothetical protein